MTSTQELATLIRRFIVRSTTQAGSGHPTSSLSATDLLSVLFFEGFFKADLDNPDHHNNDRLIFSKGHACPLLYALYAAAGKVSEEELMRLREFDSPLEGHPSMRWPYTEAATGSLGQGLSIGVGMAINAKYVDRLPYTTYVVLGDSEMAEGSNYEAMEIAAFYKLDNLVAIVDVNRLGQRGETMYGHQLDVYKRKAEAFGWHPIVIDGHDLDAIREAYKESGETADKPIMILAQTYKGKGVDFIENENGWHGKAIPQDKLDEALESIGEADESIRGEVAMPEDAEPAVLELKERVDVPTDKPIATRKVYGDVLVNLFHDFPDIVVLDAEVSNSTYSKAVKEHYPERFFEMYIAEQNMVGTALGLSRRGKIPFVSTFAAFFTRAFDQIRMSQYSDPNIKFVGSHAGVSIGEDGPSQMGLEDIAMFRTLHDCVVLYPSDAISAQKLIRNAAEHRGNVFIRTTRPSTPILYDADETFPIGKSKVLRQSENDDITLIGAGITLHEALKAHDLLKKEGISARVIDLYSIKPLDGECLTWCADETSAIITVEDHHPEGGIGEAVKHSLTGVETPVHTLAVRKLPRSGTKEELLDYEEISADAIVSTARQILS